VPLLLENPPAGETSGDAINLSSVWKGGERIGFVTSGGFGHRIGRSIALATLRTDCTAEGTEVEVEVLGERRAATVAREPLYDPQNERLRS
jgi:dimethylglycine dehydrogenase